MTGTRAFSSIDTGEFGAWDLGQIFIWVATVIASVQKTGVSFFVIDVVATGVRHIQVGANFKLKAGSGLRLTRNH